GEAQTVSQYPPFPDGRPSGGAELQAIPVPNARRHAVIDSAGYTTRQSTPSSTAPPLGSHLMSRRNPCVANGAAPTAPIAPVMLLGLLACSQFGCGRQVGEASAGPPTAIAAPVGPGNRFPADPQVDRGSLAPAAQLNRDAALRYPVAMRQVQGCRFD